MSLRMKAKRNFSLRGNKIAAGEIFPVKDRDVQMLTLGQLAELVDETQDETKAPAKRAAPRKPASSGAAKSAPKGGEKNLDAMTVDELRAHARTLGISAVTKYKKAELLGLVRSGRYARRDMRAR